MEMDKRQELKELIKEIMFDTVDEIELITNKIEESTTAISEELLLLEEWIEKLKKLKYSMIVGKEEWLLME